MGMKNPEQQAPETEGAQFDSPCEANLEAGDEYQDKLYRLLSRTVQHGGSDLHIAADSKPQVRISGGLENLEDEVISAADAERLCTSILDEHQREKLQQERNLDFPYELTGLARFRGNIFYQRRMVAAVFRVIPYRIMGFEELGVPAAVSKTIDPNPGLVLMTGATGSGKSTTLAAMIDMININHPLHIVTIEDPIEFVHFNKKSIISQREIGTDTESFNDALKYVMRQDPDVVLVGEMRDLETISAALTIAETGHLVFGTLHTNSAKQTINRIIDVFPPEQQQQIRTQLSFVVKGVMSQRLLPHKSGNGRVLAMEIMLPNKAISNLIRDNKIHQIESQMTAGQRTSGMQTFNQCINTLYSEGRISKETFQAHISQDN